MAATYCIASKSLNTVTGKGVKMAGGVGDYNNNITDKQQVQQSITGEQSEDQGTNSTGAGTDKPDVSVFEEAIKDVTRYRSGVSGLKRRYAACKKLEEQIKIKVTDTDTQRELLSQLNSQNDVYEKVSKIKKADPVDIYQKFIDMSNDEGTLLLLMHKLSKSSLSNSTRQSLYDKIFNKLNSVDSEKYHKNDSAIKDGVSVENTSELKEEQKNIKYNIYGTNEDGTARDITPYERAALTQQINQASTAEELETIKDEINSFNDFNGRKNMIKALEIKQNSFATKKSGDEDDSIDKYDKQMQKIYTKNAKAEHKEFEQEFSSVI